jgi:predicted nucleic acid-binding protein
MTAPVFVDFNLFLYAWDEADLRKQRAAQNSSAELWKSRPEARDEARAEVRELLAWNPVVTDATVLEQGWKIQDRYQLVYWDALMVAAARAASGRYLFTEDLQAGHKLDGIEVVNPFIAGPESI